MGEKAPHSHVPFSSHNAVSIVSLEGSNTATVSLVKRSRLTMGRFFPHSFILGVNTLDWIIHFVAMTTRMHWGWGSALSVPFSGHSRACWCTRGRALNYHSRWEYWRWGQQHWVCGYRRNTVGDDPWAPWWWHRSRWSWRAWARIYMCLLRLQWWRCDIHVQ